MKRTEDSLRDLCDNIKCTNIQIIGVTEEEEKRERVWEFFWRNYSWKFLQHGKGNSQVQEAQRIPYRINPKRNTPRQILIKLTKTKHKERILKSAWEKWQVTQKGNPIYLKLIFQQKLCRPERNGRIHFKYWKGKIYNQDYCTWQGSHSKLTQKWKAFQKSKT